MLPLLRRVAAECLFTLTLGIELRSYVSAPEKPTGRGLVLCHGFPQAPREAASAGLRYAELADRIALQVEM